MHLAAALSARVLAIHFWSDPAEVGPYRKDAFVWYNGKISCFEDALGSRAHPYAGLRPSMSRIADFVRAQLVLR
jgi:hypothetical protein